MKHTLRSWGSTVLLLGYTATGWASTGTSMDTVASNFVNITNLGIYLFGLTACAGLVVLVARHRGSDSYMWDNLLNIVLTVGAAASGVVIVGWAGASLASTPPPPSAYELTVPVEGPQLPTLNLDEEEAHE